MYEYKATVLRVVDGDTYDIDVDLGFSARIKHRFRLNGIDTPETWRPRNEAEREHGEKAAEFVRGLIEGKTITLCSHKLGIYGRYDADITLSDGRDLATVLIEEEFEKLDRY